ncbi:MAG: hypothetical protein ACE37F_33535 [Nannocystaceae bacterium]|nr:TerB family tellurite resistance protein [bacterium]
MTNRIISAAMALSVGVAGCESAQDSTSAEEPFALGGKADAACPPSSTLCWSGDDMEVAKAMLDLEDEVRFGYEPKKALTQIIEHANYLEHKLTDAQLQALDQVAAMVSQLPEGDFELPPVEVDEDGEMVLELPPGNYRDGVDVLATLHADVVGDMLGAYVAANVVPLGQFSETEINGKTDDTSVGEEQDFSDVEGLTPDMQRSLQLMYDSGVIGAAMATMYRGTNVLNHDYEVINAENFGEVIDGDGRIRPSGLTREAKTRHIIRKYTAAAAAVGAGAGVVALVPIAGTALSISAETFLLLKLHAQMTFEIGAVYGWDIREGDNLYLLSMLLMGEGLATEAADIVISNMLVPILSKRLARKFGVTLGAEVAERVANRSIGLLLDFFSRKAQQEIAEAALEGTARGIGRTILGWATLGAAVLVSAGLDAAATWHLGHSVEAMSKRWLGDVMLEASTYMADQRPRDCVFRGMAAMAWRDGEVSEEEKNLFVAFLAKPYALDEGSWFVLAEDEVARQAAMVGAWTEADSLSDTQECMEDEFQGSTSADRISLLGHFYSMMLIDGHADEREQDTYEAYRDGLDGDGWFDGAEIDFQHLEYVERALFLTTNPGIVVEEFAPEHTELAEQLLTADVFEFLESPNPTIRAQFDCGFEGGC